MLFGQGYDTFRCMRAQVVNRVSEPGLGSRGQTSCWKNGTDEQSIEERAELKLVMAVFKEEEQIMLWRRIHGQWIEGHGRQKRLCVKKGRNGVMLKGII